MKVILAIGGALAAFCVANACAEARPGKLSEMQYAELNWNLMRLGIAPKPDNIKRAVYDIKWLVDSYAKSPADGERCNKAVAIGFQNAKSRAGFVKWRGLIEDILIERYAIPESEMPGEVGEFIVRAALTKSFACDVGISEVSGSLVSAPPIKFPAPVPKITMAAYLQLESGMRYSQAVRILGIPGTEQSRSSLSEIDTVMYSWRGVKGSIVSATFQNGSLVLKSQAGLS